VLETQSGGKGRRGIGVCGGGVGERRGGRLSGERSGQAGRQAGRQAGWLAGRVGGGPCIDSQPLSFSLSPPTEV